MLVIHTALMAEAKPLVEYFGLKREDKSTVFSIYCSSKLVLIVSGVGAQNTIAAVAYVAGLFRQPGVDAWLNVGIAGHATMAIGAGAYVVKATRASDGQVWYPPQIAEMPGQPLELVTVDQMLSGYPEVAAVDMEAAEFINMASRFTAAELVQSYKIISDNEGAPVDIISAKSCRALISQHLQAVETAISELDSLALDLPNNATIDQTVAKFVGKIHFTASQRHQFSELLRRYKALGGESLQAEQQISQCGSAKLIIQTLERQLDPLPKLA